VNPRVVIYTLKGCRHCWRAKRLLERKELEFDEISTAGRRSPRTRQLRVEFADRFGATTFPQILIGERYIGGWRQLEELNRDGELDRLLGRVQSAERARPLFAQFYARLTACSSAAQANDRKALTAGLEGRVLGIGSGTGLEAGKSTNQAALRDGADRPQ
jgi:glutaredoxin 3